MILAIAAALAAGAVPAGDDRPAADPPRDAPIIVTARRRDEDLQSVPAAIAVVDRALTTQSYSFNTQALTVLVPSLNYSSANPRNTALTLRGLGSSVVAVSQANDGLEPGVGFYVDQVYRARPATAAFDFADIDRVEVLRGPQGTLFGKNTTAGALHILTRAPSFTPEAEAELSFGSYNLVQTRASLSGPLIDGVLAARLSGSLNRHDGTLYNVRQRRAENDVNSATIRGQLLVTPSPALALRLTIDYASFDNRCCTQVFLRVGQSQRPAARQYPALAAGVGYAPPSLAPYARLTDIDAALGVSTSEGGVALIADWRLGATTLTSVSAWRFWNWDAANDRDYTGLPIQLVQRIPSRQDQFSQELRLASARAAPITYVAGLYFFTQKITGRPISIYGPAASYWLLGPQFPAALLDGYGQDGRTRFRADSYAVFGEANWHITPRLTLTGGLRYTREEKSANYDTIVSGGLETSDPALVNARLGVLRPQRYAAANIEGNLSGRANLAWQADPRLLLYASYARGFKSGGINVSGLPLDAQNRPVLATAVIRPELNTTYEAGVKATLFEARLRLNVAGYYTQVRDFQATIVDSSQTVALRGYLSNIPRVTVAGAEADLVATPIAGVTLRGGMAYARGVYDRYPAGPCPLERQTSGTQACDLSGRPLVGLPRWSFSLGSDIERPARALGLGGRLFLHSDTSWRSGYFGEPALSAVSYIVAYSITNAAIGYRTPRWEVALFARNLFDARYIQNLTVQAGNSGLILGLPGDPRFIGVTLRLHG